VVVNQEPYISLSGYINYENVHLVHEDCIPILNWSVGKYFQASCCTSGQRIHLASGMRLIFEVDNLSQASPATISRCAMVYMVG
jgi:hypothetical protein